jgi:hypothetical protein
MRSWAGCSLWLAALLPGQAPDRFATAVADYRAGRYDAAFHGFQAELAAQGENATDELRWNTALAALRAQRSGDAEAALAPWLDASAGERVAGAGPTGERRADAEFVTAMACCQRAERAAAAAQLPDAEPTAWTMAVQAMTRAIAAFERAVQQRGTWPEASRNRDRAKARLDELREMQKRAAPTAKQEQPPEPQPPPQQPEPTPEETPADLAVEPLAQQELAELVRRIAKKDQTKRALRQERQRAAVTAGDRGW